MYYRDWLDNKIVVGTDWPLSLGWKITFTSCNKNFVNKTHYVSKKKINEAFGKEGKLRNKGIEGYACTWDQKRVRAILILYKGKSSVRFIELLSHEISHVIDYIFIDTHIKVIDTELRAYLMDWLMGKFIMATNLNNKTKKGYKLEGKLIPFNKGKKHKPKSKSKNKGKK